MDLKPCLKLSEIPWQEELKFSFRSAEDLAEHHFIPRESVPQYQKLLQKYPLILSRYYASLIDRSDPNCPIRRQAIPHLDEEKQGGDFQADPLNDLKHQPAPRITHRYPDRVLFHLTPHCSMYCRFCFRKNLLNEFSEELFRGQVEEAVTYIKGQRKIHEVIFSGGDPFMVKDAFLGKLVAELSSLAHLKRLRFHTRVPVTFPCRVTSDLAEAVGASPLPVSVVTHFNHPKEVTSASAEACRILNKHGIHLFNQSVLLRGVNHRAETLAMLSEALFGIGVIPYYLHHPDRAQGTEHFDLSYQTGLAIYEDLRGKLPGYLVPKYVVDRPEYPYKIEVSALMSRCGE